MSWGLCRTDQGTEKTEKTDGERPLVINSDEPWEFGVKCRVGLESVTKDGTNVGKKHNTHVESSLKQDSCSTSPWGTTNQGSDLQSELLRGIHWP